MKTRNEKGTDKQYRIVIPVADEIFAKVMIDFLKDHTWPENTEFHLVHVIEPNPLKTPLILDEVAMKELTEDERQSGRTVLGITQRLLRAGIPEARVHAHMDEGDARMQILKLASKLPADMIVLGSHGRTGFNRFILGSVANAVAEHAPCSVCILRLSQEQIDQERLLELSLADLPEDMKAHQIEEEDSEAVLSR